VIFRQLIDPETSTYTYLLADEHCFEAILIDTVIEQFNRDRTLLEELGLTLRYTLETHVHADHVTASSRFRQELGCKVVVGARSGVVNADVAIGDNETLAFGAHRLTAVSTPGHTSGCVTYLCREAGMAFTGDTLLIRGCGRSDFQDGDAATLFESVRNKIFSLPERTLLYPGHDYKGRTVTTVREEKRFNPRLCLDRSRSDFLTLMEQLNLTYPRKMDVAVPANLESGLALPHEPETDAPGKRAGSVAGVMEILGRQDAEMSMGMGI